VSLLSNPTLLIALAIGAFLLLGGGGKGGGLNVTDLLLTLLRSMKLIPEPTPPASEQIWRGYVQRAWDKMRGGNLADARTLLDAAVQESESQLATETAIVPAALKDTLGEWLKSPIFLIAIAVGAFLIFGGGSCKQQPNAAPEAAEVETASVPHRDSWTLCSLDDPSPDWTFEACDTSAPLDASEAGWWTDGPVRATVSAPVRAVVRARPLRRVGAAIARPFRRLAAACRRR
jgi:hypothetical protein